ncbi:MAG: TlyA family RNA methyltransferase, partial [Pseudothermotoga sp.]
GRFVAQSKECHSKVIAKIFHDSALQGLFACDLTYSPITGSDGNIEYLAYFSKSRPNVTVDNEGILSVVEQAWSVFRGEQ